MSSKPQSILPTATGSDTAGSVGVQAVRPPPVPPQRPSPPTRIDEPDICGGSPSATAGSAGPRARESIRVVASEAAAIAARGKRRRTASVPERDMMLVANELARTINLAGKGAASSRRASKRKTGKADILTRELSKLNGLHPQAFGERNAEGHASSSSSTTDSDSDIDDGLSEDADHESGSDAMAAVTMLRRMRGIAALTGGKAEIGLEDLDILANIVQGVAYGAADESTFKHAMTQHFVHNPDVFDDPEVKSFLMAQYIPHHGAVGSFGSSSKQRAVRALAAAGGLHGSLSVIGAGSGG